MRFKHPIGETVFWCYDNHGKASITSGIIDAYSVNVNRAEYFIRSGDTKFFPVAASHFTTNIKAAIRERRKLNQRVKRGEVKLGRTGFKAWKIRY